MAGPCSFPEGDKRRWAELNETVCDKHFVCNMRTHDDKDNVVVHDYITYREWLFRRHRLTTGKT